MKKQEVTVPAEKFEAALNLCLRYNLQKHLRYKVRRRLTPLLKKIWREKQTNPTRSIRWTKVEKVGDRKFRIHSESSHHAPFETYKLLKSASGLNEVNTLLVEMSRRQRSTFQREFRAEGGKSRVVVQEHELGIVAKIAASHLKAGPPEQSEFDDCIKHAWRLIRWLTGKRLTGGFAGQQPTGKGAQKTRGEYKGENRFSGYLWWFMLGLSEICEEPLLASEHRVKALKHEMNKR